MAIEATYLNPMLDPFRNMVQECEEKELTGEDFEIMKRCLARMEQLGKELNDISEFSGLLMQENIYITFSNHYGKLLANSYKSAYNPEDPYDEKADQALLKQSVNAYKDAIRQIMKSKQDAKDMKGEEAADVDVLFKEKFLTDAIQKVVDLGESGLSYPQFLSQMMELGLDKAMEGSVLQKYALEYQYEWAKAMASSPFSIQLEEKKLTLYEQLVSTNEWKIADQLLYNTGCEKLEWEMAPAIASWEAYKVKWEVLIDKLDHWIMSQTSFAHTIFPWVEHSNPWSSVKESRACTPGEFKYYEELVMKYFNCSFYKLLQHPSFKWEIDFLFFYYSDEYTWFLITEVYPACIPHKDPPKELVKKAEAFYTSKRIYRADCNSMHFRMEKVFDKYFGEGEYIRRNGYPGKSPVTNALSFNAEEFFAKLELMQ